MRGTIGASILAPLWCSGTPSPAPWTVHLASTGTSIALGSSASYKTVLLRTVLPLFLIFTLYLCKNLFCAIHYAIIYVLCLNYSLSNSIRLVKRVTMYSPFLHSCEFFFFFFGVVVVTIIILFCFSALLNNMVWRRINM